MVVSIREHFDEVTGRLNSVRCSVFTEHRTAGIMAAMDSEALLMDALAQLGVRARQVVSESDRGIDLVLEPVGTRVQIKRRALVTDDVAERLLAETRRCPVRCCSGG